MSSLPEVIVTGDGSHSLYLPGLRETYHSTHGAVQESDHVFIRSGLEAKAAIQSCELSVFEVGFGTGLNVLLTAIWAANSGRQVNMTSIEAYPVSEQIWRTLNYAQQAVVPEAITWWENIHQADWNRIAKIHPQMSLRKLHAKLEEYPLPENEFDVVYYDAFAPGKQASMWTTELLSKTVSSLKKGGFLVTYCAQGQFKRNLSALGLEIETLAGTPGKKEMTRARKPDPESF